MRNAPQAMRSNYAPFYIKLPLLSEECTLICAAGEQPPRTALTDSELVPPLSLTSKLVVLFNLPHSQKDCVFLGDVTSLCFHPIKYLSTVHHVMQYSQK
ncbi:hypothetical protein CEXT_466261 [Caerostris extrusa]|uniref:Uncharacterized protein n=1 Tax=Caerostris extrusa TaxID=172846 RepID=A0AAV4WSL6_CAEEX|nr:hypothetical protein CEXT_466261 [Caerostris extrusa]